MPNLKSLGIQTIHPGAYDGRWRKTAGEVLVSENPSTGDALGRVRMATSGDYDEVVAAAHAAFLRWRLVPAPKRGEYVRRIGQRLRERKEDLGGWELQADGMRPGRPPSAARGSVAGALEAGTRQALGVPRPGVLRRLWPQPHL